LGWVGLGWGEGRGGEGRRWDGWDGMGRGGGKDFSFWRAMVFSILVDMVFGGVGVVGVVVVVVVVVVAVVVLVVWEWEWVGGC